MSNNIKQDQITSEDDIEFELIDKGLMKSSKDGNNYINNKEFYEELKKYHAHKIECLEKGLDIPPLTHKIGVAILQIAERRCNSRMYRGYTNNWKEELVSNATVVATLLGHNFDPEKSSNPFAYFTMICDNAIKEQLKKEKKQLYIRYKSIDESHGFQAIEDENSNDDFVQHLEEVDSTYQDRLKFINDYEERNFNKSQKEEVEQDRGVFRLED